LLSGASDTLSQIHQQSGAENPESYTGARCRPSSWAMCRSTSRTTSSAGTPSEATKPGETANYRQRRRDRVRTFADHPQQVVEHLFGGRLGGGPRTPGISRTFATSA